MAVESKGGPVWALTILFIALKLTHVISWSWVWVLSPLWISAGVTVFLLLVILLFGLIAAILGTRR